MSKNRISEDDLKKLPTPESGTKSHWFGGCQLRGETAPDGFGVRVSAKGTKVFVYRYRKDGQQYLETIGTWLGSGGTLPVLDAIKATIKRMQAIEKGLEQPGKVILERKPKVEKVTLTPPSRHDVTDVTGKTIADVLDEFIARGAGKERELRTVTRIKNTFDLVVKPAIGNVGIYELKRGPVIRLLDDIADGKAGVDGNKGGPIAANRALAYIRSAFNWYAGRDEDFMSPLVKKMPRKMERSRERVLDNQELQDLWRALDVVKNVPECYPRYIRMLLLTATRRTEAADMHSSEVIGDLWIIPAARYKRLPKHADKDHVIQLSPEAQALIGDRTGFVFSSDGGTTAFSGFSKAKRELDRTINRIRKEDGREPMADWRLHDLRRTARTLMAEAGIPSEHAERCLGHILTGMVGTYNRFEYAKEKRRAFESLAGIVKLITNPQPNVVSIRPAVPA